jgi:hypothetical protein
MSRDIVPTCPEIRHGWAGRIPVAGYGPTRYAWLALQRVPVLRHGVQVAGPRAVVRRQDRRAAGRLALATSRLAGGRVPAPLWWSELHTGTQSVHVLPPPPRRPWRVRTVTGADSVPLSCAVMSLIRPPARSLCPRFEPGPVAGPCICEHLLEVRGEGHLAPQAARRGRRGRGPTAGAGGSVRGGGAGREPVRRSAHRGWVWLRRPLVVGDGVELVHDRPRTRSPGGIEAGPDENDGDRAAKKAS